MHDRPLVLDTVTLILWHNDDIRLSPRAKAALGEAPNREIHVSAVSAFEIANKVRLGKLAVPRAMLEDFNYVVTSDGFQRLDVDPASALAAGLLSSTHRDPFDRLIAAQAIRLGAFVVTNDSAFVDLGADVLW
jgi:PIN domain nuclease of toxin-antitoxin system